MVEQANVRLQLANTAENVVAVRSVLSGLAEQAGVDGNELGDIRTAVTEACDNVVLHAYRGARGPLVVELKLHEGELCATVRDEGVGIAAHLHEDDDDPQPAGLGIGLHVIRTLARDVCFEQPHQGGTCVRMRLQARASRPAGPGLQMDAAAREARATALWEGEDGPGQAVISIAPVALARPILPRLVATLLARAHFSTDRIADVQLLTDAIAAHADEVLDERRLSVAVAVRPRELRLVLAPLRPGSAHGLLGASDLDGVGRVIERLADSHRAGARAGYDTLALSLLDHSRG